MATEKITRFSLPDNSNPKEDASQPLLANLPPRSHLPRVEFRLEQRRHVRGLLAIIYAVCVSWIARLTPGPLRNWLGKKGGDLSYRLSKNYRLNATNNLRQVMGPEYSDRALKEMVRRVFRSGGQNMIDLLMIPHMSPQEIVSQVKLVSGQWSYLDEAFAEGKGVVIVTGHLGAFDLVGQALHNRGYKLTSVTGRTTSRFLFDAVTFLRRSHNMNLVEVSPSGIRRVIKALQRGEGAVFVTDRDFFTNGMQVNFFGRDTTLSQGAVRIARDTGALIVPIFGVRTDLGHGLRVERPFRVARTAHREADIARGLNQIVPLLEDAIRATPDQWVMYQPVWPLEPVDHSD